MHLALLTVTLRLHGCTSLKEKRRRVRGAMVRLGTNSNLAVHESGCQNEHKHAQWSFVCIAMSNAQIEQSFDQVERCLLDRVDGEIISVERSRL